MYEERKHRLAHHRWLLVLVSRTSMVMDLKLWFLRSVWLRKYKHWIAHSPTSNQTKPNQTKPKINQLITWEI